MVAKVAPPDDVLLHEDIEVDNVGSDDIKVPESVISIQASDITSPGPIDVTSIHDISF